MVAAAAAGMAILHRLHRPFLHRYLHQAVGLEWVVALAPLVVVVELEVVEQ